METLTIKWGAHFEFLDETVIVASVKIDYMKFFPISIFPEVAVCDHHHAQQFLVDYSYPLCTLPPNLPPKATY